MKIFICCCQAVLDDFYFQMYYDNLPIWGFIGALHSLVFFQIPLACKLCMLPGPLRYAESAIRYRMPVECSQQL